jgi:hypothetical protein
MEAPRQKLIKESATVVATTTFAVVAALLGAALAELEGSTVATVEDDIEKV